MERGAHFFNRRSDSYLDLAVKLEKPKSKWSRCPDRHRIQDADAWIAGLERIIRRPSGFSTTPLMYTVITLPTMDAFKVSPCLRP